MADSGIKIVRLKGTLSIMLLGVGPEGASFNVNVLEPGGGVIIQHGPYTLHRGEQLDFEGVEIGVIARIAEGHVRDKPTPGATEGSEGREGRSEAKGV